MNRRSSSIAMHSIKEFGGVKVQLNLFLTLTLDGGASSATSLDRFTPLTKSPVGLKILDIFEKRGFLVTILTELSRRSFSLIIRSQNVD